MTMIRLHNVHEGPSSLPGDISVSGPGEVVEVPYDVANDVLAMPYSGWREAPEELVEDEDEVSEIPPKSGKGSGVAAWREFAAANGVEVDEDADKDAVIAALEDAGVATEKE